MTDDYYNIIVKSFFFFFTVFVLSWEVQYLYTNGNDFLLILTY